MPWNSSKGAGHTIHDPFSDIGFLPMHLGQAFFYCRKLGDVCGTTRQIIEHPKWDDTDLGIRLILDRLWKESNYRVAMKYLYE